VEQYWAAVEIVAGFLPSVGPNLIVGGFSQGAMITYGLLVKHPELIAHAVLLSGRAVGENRPEFSGRVFQAHGLQDEVIPFADADAMRTSLEPLGERLEFHSYPMGHSVSMEEMEDLNAWLKAVTSSSAEL
jgi:phospholipase/carboxylesterase